MSALSSSDRLDDLPVIHPGYGSISGLERLAPQPTKSTSYSILFKSIAAITICVVLGSGLYHFAHSGTKSRAPSAFSQAQQQAYNGNRLALEHHSHTRKLPKGWFQGLESAHDEQVELTMAIKNKEGSLFAQLCREVSDPMSPSYGQYMSLDEIRELSYSQHAIDAVQHWVKSHTDATSTTMRLSRNGEFLHVRTSVSSAQRLLGTTFYAHHHASSNTTIHRAKTYTVPESIAQHLDMVGGVVQLPSQKKYKVKSFRAVPKDQPAEQRQQQQQQQQRQPTIDDLPANDHVGQPITTPQFLKRVYNVDWAKFPPHPDSTQAVAEFPEPGAPEFYLADDMAEFYRFFKLEPQPIKLLGGQNRPAECAKASEEEGGDTCGEAMLDIEYMVGLSNQPAAFWLTHKEADFDHLLRWISYVAESPHLELVHSVSFGDSEHFFSAQYLDRLDQEFAKVCMRGISMVVASGDAGVSDLDVDREDTQDIEAGCSVFRPDFPASNPHVTAVGATQFLPDGREVVCSIATQAHITSGGGFSAHFPRPYYQEQHVQSYLERMKSGANSTLPPDTAYNPLGRAFPDVTLLGHNYLVFNLGQGGLVDGTSCSTPAFGAMLALVNNQRLSHGLPPVGFVNPLLYYLQHPDGRASSSFNDIVDGDNSCAEEFCCPHGFAASKGWDAAAGVGSVNLEGFAQAAMKLFDELPHLRERYAKSNDLLRL